MSGTKAGGIKTAKANKERHGSDFYKRIGAMGGASGNTGGFQKGSELARIAGRKGGRISKRGPANVKLGDTWKDQNSTSLPSITKQQIETCASCRNTFEKNTTLDEWGLCPECPKTEAPRRGFFSRMRPF